LRSREKRAGLLFSAWLHLIALALLLAYRPTFLPRPTDDGEPTLRLKHVELLPRPVVRMDAQPPTGPEAAGSSMRREGKPASAAPPISITPKPQLIAPAPLLPLNTAPHPPTDPGQSGAIASATMGSSDSSSGLGSGAGTGSGGSSGAGSGSGTGSGSGRSEESFAAPDWIRKPTDREMLFNNPPYARRMAISGGAVLACRVDRRNRAHGCQVLSEAPKGYGFGRAALSLSPLFRIKPPSRNGQPQWDVRVRIPVILRNCNARDRKCRD
jgi:hypothetical protein